MPYNGLIESTSFSGHESFPLRFAWLKKGYDNLVHNPSFFGDDDAMVDLGVGKNMVRAIRHWGLACEIWSEKEGSRGGRELEPTKLGAALFASNGWDPYLEDPGTLWWLHWRLVRNPERATTWAWAFGIRGGVSRLSRDELVVEIDALQREFSGRISPRSSLKRDVDVLARSYIRDGGHRRGYEDALDSPLAELGLIRQGPEKGSIEFLASDWPTLSLGIFEAMLADYCLHREQTTARRGQNIITLNDLLYRVGSPGRILRLTEYGLVRRLSALQADGWRYDETSGLRQLIVPREVPDPMILLEKHYSSARHRKVA